MPAIYPQSSLDNKTAGLETLSSFWTEVFDDQETLASWLQAMAIQAKQALNNADENLKLCQRSNAPIWHRQLWHNIQALESTLTDNTVIPLRYGDGSVYGPQANGDINHYGQGSYPAKYASGVDNQLVVMPLICNRAKNSTVIWTEGLDYYLDRESSAVVFARNPFDYDFEIRDVVAEPADRQIDIWACHSQWDARDISNRWGYPLHLELQSSSNYRELVNSVYDALCQGTTLNHIRRVITAITDIPHARNEGETVEQILTDSRGQVVITDVSVYRVSNLATLAVSVGDVLSYGQHIAEELQIHEFHNGTVPESITALAVTKNFLSSAYYDGLIFENKIVPLVVETEDGRTRVSFEIGGLPEDVERFWDELHAKGVAADETLANLLDVRETPVGEPTSASLPTTINPLEFLLSNILRNNAFLVELGVSAVGANALDLGNLRILRRLVPAQNALIFLMRLTGGQEVIELTGEDQIIFGAPVATLTPGFFTEETLSLDDLLGEESAKLSYTKTCAEGA